MLKPHSPTFKYFIYATKALALLVLGLIIWAVITFVLSGQRDKQAIDAAVRDIKLPPQYQLVSSVYVNPRCLDVCAHTVLKYRSADATPLSQAAVIAELKQLGYSYDAPYYYKTYKHKQVHIDQTNFPPTQLTLDVSL
jgi:hypothetical protein